MKKFFLTAVVALFVATSMLAQDTLGIHPYKDVNPVSPKLQNVSLFIEGGFNLFDGDFTSEQKNIMSLPTLGGGLLYSFNCTWGLGAEYKYRQYGVESKGAPTYVDGPLLKGNMHQVDAFMTFDVFNCFCPKVKHKIFALDLLIGGGAAWSKNSVYYPATDKNGEKKRLAYAGDVSFADDKYKPVGVFLGGASFEFNVSRSIELGLRCVYNMYTNDKVDGRTCSTNNDGIFDTDLLLRWKIGAKKNSHVRNMASEGVLEDMVLAQRGDMDAAPVYVPAGKDTVVILHKDTVMMMRDRSMVPGRQYYYVYFANDDYQMSDQALATVQQVADRLNRDSTLCIEVIGYCDNTGTYEHNKTLGFSRAKRVQEELILEYGVDADRTYIEGRGIIQGRHSTAAYSPNRRVEIRLLSRSEFKRLYPDALKTAVDNVTNKVGRIVTIKEHVTLSKLAREYYGNTHCWIYIYEANKDTMTSPSNTRPGMTLFIPEITEEEKAITKEQADARYHKK